MTTRLNVKPRAMTASASRRVDRRVVLLTALLGWSSVSAQTVGLSVVAHPSVTGKIDLNLLGRLYTGRAVEIEGQLVIATHLSSGSKAREQFLATVLRQTEADYRAYWTVRRHVGKGTPPREFADAQALQAYVASTPGAIGYVPSTERNRELRELLSL